MINKPKKQSSSLYLLVVITFFIPLAGLFVYATHYQKSFFVYIVLGLLVNIGILAVFHRRLTHKQSIIRLHKEEYFEKANLLRAELELEWRAIESFRKKIISYSQLKNLAEKLSQCLTLEDTSNMLSSQASQLFGHAEITVILYLFQSQTGELGISSSKKGQMQVNIKSKKGDFFDQWVIKTLQPLLIEDARTDFRFDMDKLKGEEIRNIRALISAPLIIGSKTLGILRIDSHLPHYFATEDLRFLQTIADLGSVAIENAQLYEKIEDMAITDGLTGLYLRRYMLERLGEEITREMRKKKPLSFIMIDLDRFKQYNDTFGHTAGDIVLRQVSQILKEHFRQPGNLVCRYGGEEFCVVLPDCTKEKAAQLAESVRQKIEQHDIILRRQKTHVTISLGIAAFPKDAQLKEELIQKADAALYQAKEGGRNQACVT